MQFVVYSKILRALYFIYYVYHLLLYDFPYIKIKEPWWNIEKFTLLYFGVLKVTSASFKFVLVNSYWEYVNFVQSKYSHTKTIYLEENYTLPIKLFRRN